jgi:carbon-monoxide dehydrogenase catalytic subunit
METIHLKTVDHISQELLRSASKQGLELSWDRFEKLQPQDGFLRLGLSCPFGCLQGPCRIDPFGRGAQKGVCGMGQDEMVAGMLLRICLQGTMEALADVPAGNRTPDIRFSSTLGKMVSRVLSKDDQEDLSMDDIFKSISMLQRPSSSYRTLLSQALRLSLLTLGLQEQGDTVTDTDSKPCEIGYGTILNQSTRIALSGTPSAALVGALDQETKMDGETSKLLVSLGEWIELEDSFVPITCTTGESELLISSGAIHLLVTGPDTEPGLIHLCETMNIPVVSDSDNLGAGDIWLRAQRSLESRSQLDLFSDAPLVQESQVLMSGNSITQQERLGNDGNIAILGGSDNPQVSLGKLPVSLATKLIDQQFQLAGWGDPALWVLKAGALSQEESLPILTFENRQGPLHVVKGLESEGQMQRLKGICFTGLKSCQELAAATGMAYLGCRVSLATPIPIQGSSAVMDALSEMLHPQGGQLLHFDHPAHVGELVEWFTNP